MPADPMDEVVGRVGGAVSRLRAIGMMFDTAVGDADAIDSLLAAYQSVRDDKARLDWLEDHGGFETPDGKEGMSMARWGRSSDLTLREALDRARTGGTE